MQYQAIKTIQFKTYNTRRNLPPEVGRKRGESNFLGSFEKVLLSDQFTTGYGGRNFSMANHGIADFIWFKTDTITTRNNMREMPKGILYAFETKLKNWKKAFQQAYRYSFFSDKSIVVLPSDCPSAALDNRSFFKENNIGLWLFNREKRCITKIVSPATRAARNKKARKKALDLLLSHIQFA